MKRSILTARSAPRIGYPWRRAALAAALLSLAACSSSPPLRFYSLAAPAADAAPAAQTMQTRSAGLFIELAPVGVPERLTRPQIVVQKSDGRIDVLEQDRWTSSFDSELRDTLANGLAARLGAIDALRGGRQPGQPVYRIAIDLRQFDAIGGERVNAAFGWTVTRIGGDGDRAASCQSAFSVPVAGGTTDALVKGMQTAVAMATAAIAATVDSVRDGGPAACGS
jgi:uncharacterized lipoprotein YmbA